MEEENKPVEEETEVTPTPEEEAPVETPVQEESEDPTL